MDFISFNFCIKNQTQSKYYHINLYIIKNQTQSKHCYICEKITRNGAPSIIIITGSDEVMRTLWFLSLPYQTCKSIIMASDLHLFFITL